MLARVKQDYLAGSVTAFSGREYVRSEWREVPAGFEKEAAHHPLLDTQPSLDEVRAESAGLPGLGVTESPEALVTVETAEPQATEPPAEEPVSEDTEPKATRRRRRPAGE